MAENEQLKICNCHTGHVVSESHYSDCQPWRLISPFLSAPLATFMIQCQHFLNVNVSVISQSSLISLILICIATDGTFNAVVTCEIKSFQNYFSLRPRLTERHTERDIEVYYTSIDRDVTNIHMYLHYCGAVTVSNNLLLELLRRHFTGVALLLSAQKYFQLQMIWKTIEHPNDKFVAFLYIRSTEYRIDV